LKFFIGQTWDTATMLLMAHGFELLSLL